MFNERTSSLKQININVNAAEGVGLKTISGWLFWLHSVGLIMSVIGFMTVYWYYDSEMWMGIWNICKPYDFPLLYGLFFFIFLMFYVFLCVQVSFYD